MLLKALERNNRGPVPVWLMRQAGRYMPSYQKIKAGRNLIDIFRDSDLVVEITYLPVEELHVDAAILFSDILILLEGYAIAYTFEEKRGPVILQKVDSLPSFDKDKLSFLYRAIKTLSSSLKVPLIGFAGGPFTIASYLIEGGSSTNFKQVKTLLYNEPKQFEALIDALTQGVITFIDAQVEAGVQVVQLFDSWATQLSYSDFMKYSISVLKRIVRERKYKEVPLIYFTRGAAHFAREIAATGVSCISVDSSIELSTLNHLSLTLQGNLDPCALYGSHKAIEQEVKRILSSVDREKFIFNLGHGVLPDTSFDKVKFLIECVKCHG